MKPYLHKYNTGIGKRKKAIARVCLVPGSGNLIINKKWGLLYFQNNHDYLFDLWEIFKVIVSTPDVDIVVFVKGGGLAGQAEAIELGLIRIICRHSKEWRSIFKRYGLLTRDSRIKERKKYGLRKARKAPQYSKR
jgi:small subunit ribosomal protein S9